MANSNSNNNNNNSSRHSTHLSSYEELPLQRGRPWLYPYNRRLRHVHGISIRNLALSAAKARPRGNTVDDAALPTSLRSPAKALAQQERKQVEHSRSITDLKAIAESDNAHAHAHTHGHAHASPRPSHESAADGSPSAKRPAMRRLRRRSTLDWQNASSAWRQQKLEDVISSNMADVFFSLHVTDQDEPIYISEVIAHTMNPDFRFFDLNTCGPGVSRLEDVIVKLWARPGVNTNASANASASASASADWQFLLEMHLNLRSLQFIGKTIEGFPQPLPQNCVLFHLKDGIYTTFLDNFMGEPSAHTSIAPPTRTMSMPQVLPTSSYDALMRLSTLDECIQDALATRAKLEDEINAILGANQTAITAVTEARYQATALHELEAAISTERRRLAQVTRRRDEARARLAQRKLLIQEGYASITQGQETDVPTLHEEISHRGSELTSLSEETLGQRRRICQDLQRILPITPVPNSKRALHFAIRDLPLSNSTLDAGFDNDAASMEATAAALGYVALLAHNLSFYLSTPLPYPITPRSSTSTILDPISEVAGGTTSHIHIHTSSHNTNMSSAKNTQARTYPLFPTRGPRFRLEFAWFLLNKDIEFLSLSKAVGIGRVLDLRQTLPNLLYLFYVATAGGTGEVPLRKAGGIRGFLRGGGSGAGGKAGGGDSRRESMDSVISGKGSGKEVLTVVDKALRAVQAEEGGGGGRTKKSGYGTPNVNVNVSANGRLAQTAAVGKGSKLRDGAVK